jgi:hypothetical protein
MTKLIRAICESEGSAIKRCWNQSQGWRRSPNNKASNLDQLFEGWSRDAHGGLIAPRRKPQDIRNTQGITSISKDSMPTVLYKQKNNLRFAPRKRMTLRTVQGLKWLFLPKMSITSLECCGMLLEAQTNSFFHPISPNLIYPESVFFEGLVGRTV